MNDPNDQNLKIKKISLAYKTNQSINVFKLLLISIF